MWSLTIFRESSLEPTSRLAKPRRDGAEIHIVRRDDTGHRQAARVSINRSSGVAAAASARRAATRCRIIRRIAS